MTENENQEQPETVEASALEINLDTVEATVVSESAPVADPSDTPDASAPTDTTEEIVELAPEQPAAPLAKIAAADAILAKYNAAIAERDALRAELIAAKGQLTSEREALSRLEASLGLAPARVVPIIENSAPEAADPVAEYLAAVEAGDRQAASRLFEKHKAVLWQHRNKLSKA